MGMLLRKHRAADNAASVVNDEVDIIVKEEKVETEIIPEESEGSKYSKSEISRMSTADLKELAATLGIPDASGKVLKEEIIAKLGL